MCTYFGGDRVAFDNIVDAEAMNLEAVQQLLYARSIDTAVAIDELSYLQPLVTLNRFLIHLFTKS